MKNNLFIIAQAGWRYIGAAFLAFVFFMIVDWELLAFVAFVVGVVLLVIFRNPEREMLHYDDESILSPVDGVITAITELQDEEYAYKLEIQSGYFDVSVLRAPINAQSLSVEFKKGARLSKKSTHLHTLNERVSLLLRSSSNNTIKIEHLLTQSIAPLSIDAKASKELYKGSRYGVMVCGVTCVYLPADVRLSVGLLSEVKASQTLLAYFS